MAGYLEAPRALALTCAMARVVGLRLPQAVLDGWLTRKDLTQLLDRCQTCSAEAKCTAFLGRTLYDSRLPSYCPNAGALAALSPEI